ALMKYLGIDFGTKRVGLAVSDPAGSIAFPREIVPNDDNLFPYLVRLLDEENIEAIVVGDTRAESGSANQASGAADVFIEQLSRVTSMPIHRGREAWSSVEASRFAPPGKMRDDSAAAAIILQRFLDTNTKK
ncbi:MAG TPA: RuvX/YqgF family protein, partial [Candidatus Paceibacterota bacterium]|nr:RuvX/YqgF family protein [Candidatus Paceibacterota bacterium]